MLNKLKNLYITSRLCKVDEDFLSYEEDFIPKEDLTMIITLLEDKTLSKVKNNHNSIILYITGLSDEFDFVKARCDTINGSPPDIDIDFDAIDREKAIDWVVENWGRDNVANIITHGTFKPKSLLRGFYRVTEGEPNHLNELLKKIPQPKFGKEATLQEILDLNEGIQTEKKYSEFLEFACKTEDMVSTFGIHAAGIVISDFPIHDIVPMWKNSKAERITQFNKDEVEELGLIKFDFLSIDTLSIIKECVRLVKATTSEDINIFDIEDCDQKAYSLMNSGLLTGIFQMETSGNAKKLIQDIQPQNIDELSDISALNRPGPMQAKVDKQYIKNKKLGYSEKELPEVLSKILESTNYTLVYQEQVMEICSKIAGFSLKEADDIRRAMGKKKKKVLDEYEPLFITGAKTKGIPASDAKKLWDDLVGFADYCLHGNTRVITKEYGPIAISKIVENNMPLTVFSLDINGSIVEQTISQFWSKGYRQCYSYILENSKRITCTPNHNFVILDKKIEIEKIYKEKKDLEWRKHG
jgi:DNA polymerase-3 subunit alpha